ncbi:MAG: T9SS type A sorting domain-containing protein [Flavobacteriales bacterium]|nr:T9SS type A sorting domain-containing protein [Flavobacteriales bacterium]
MTGYFYMTNHPAVKSLSTIAVLLIPMLTRGQCDISVPANAMVVSTGSVTIDQSDTVIWICADVTNLVLSGSNNTYIMTGFGSVGLSGTDNTAYIRNGNYWTITGNGNTVYEGFGADAMLAGGSKSTIIACPSMIIDLSNAPVPGCSAVGINEQGGDASWSVRSTGNVLEVTLKAGPAVYRITDAQGRAVLNGTLQGGYNSVDLSSLPAGVYILLDPDRRVVLRFAKS